MTKRPIASAEFQAQVLRAMPLPPAWVTAKQMYQRIDQGSFDGIKHALLALVKAGKVARFGPLECPAFRRVDLPEFRPDKAAQALIRQYREDLAEYKGTTHGNQYSRSRRTLR